MRVGVLMERLDKINYYLDIAETVAKRGTCLRKNFGCIIVKNDEIISTGYTGAPRGRINCIDLGYCTKKEKFPNVHQGANSCQTCRKLIINAGIKELVVRGEKRGEYLVVNVDDWVKNDDLLQGKNTY